MARLLFKEGNFKILSDDMGKMSLEEALKLIWIAGTTCYQSKEDTKKTPEEMVRMFKERGHYAMLDHSWFTFDIACGNQDNQLRDSCIAGLFLANNLFKITYSNDGFFVSGNSRMFMEAHLRDPKNFLLSLLVSILSRENNTLFSYDPLRHENYEVSLSRLDKSKAMERSYYHPRLCFWITIRPKLAGKRQILSHRAMSVEFNNCSRGMTHEFVRHRRKGFGQESTRYVDYSKGKKDLDNSQLSFILPFLKEVNPNDLIEVQVGNLTTEISMKQAVDFMENFYKALRRDNYLTPGEARQFLPIGTKAQIVASANLESWRHYFLQRTNKSAHWEIRYIATNLLKETQKRIPEVFDDFEIAKDGESAKYIGDDPLHLV